MKKLLITILAILILSTPAMAESKKRYTKEDLQQMYESGEATPIKTSVIAADESDRMGTLLIYQSQLLEQSVNQVEETKELKELVRENSELLKKLIKLLEKK